MTKKKMNKSTIVLLAVIVILVAVVVVQAVMLGTLKNQPVQTGTYMDTPSLAFGADNTEPTQPEEPGGEPFHTQYIDLLYPDDLVNEMSVNTEETEDGSVIVFSGVFSGKPLDLFSITLSKDFVDGYVLGSLKHESAGELVVTMQMNEQDAADWSDEDYVRINALQERVNDIIVQFYEDPRFSPSH